MTYQIKTPRMTLAPFASRDLSRFVTLANDPAVARMTSSFAHPFTRLHATSWLARHEKARQAGTDHLFAIQLQSGGFAGAIGIDRQPGELFNLGYWLGREFWGKGYASEAVGALVGWAEDEMGIKAIHADFFEDNLASANVLEKSGFLRTGQSQMSTSLGRDTESRAISMVWLGSTSGMA
ncbi:MAG: GNAT family N-acetyltransferase [Robiginitomaculum sp.]|nr:MAG: GNAT family N-acetyltransferase [Robiginitomaculum sp.]